MFSFVGWNLFLLLRCPLWRPFCNFWSKKKSFCYFMNFLSSNPGPVSGSGFTWNAGSGSVSGSGFNESGSTTLKKRNAVLYEFGTSSGRWYCTYKKIVIYSNCWTWSSSVLLNNRYRRYVLPRLSVALPLLFFLIQRIFFWSEKKILYCFFPPICQSGFSFSQRFLLAPLSYRYCISTH